MTRTKVFSKDYLVNELDFFDTMMVNLFKELHVAMESLEKM